jgi:hypothetical protein
MIENHSNTSETAARAEQTNALTFIEVFPQVPYRDFHALGDRH